MFLFIFDCLQSTFLLNFVVSVLGGFFGVNVSVMTATTREILEIILDKKLDPLCKNWRAINRRADVIEVDRS